MNTIALLGSGTLHHAIKTRIGKIAHWRVIVPAAIEDVSDADVVIAALDVPDMTWLFDLNRKAFFGGQIFLPVWAEFGEIRIGPLVTRHEGCLECAETRRINNEPKAMFHKVALAQSAAMPSEPIPTVCAQIVAGTVILWLRFLSERGDQDEHTIWLMDSGTLEASLHRFLPDPRCCVCDTRPDDTAATVLRFEFSRPTPAAWRVHSFDGALEELKQSFVDQRTGLITTVGTDITTNIAAPGPARHRIADYHQEDWTAGLTYRFPRSQTIGIIEAIERYAGLRPRARRTTVRGSYHVLKKHAIDPRSLILYSPEQYVSTAFPCEPFRQDMELSWVWAYSYRRSGPILVPEQVAFYDIGMQPIHERFVVENSNGCAAGGCPEEAAFFGLLEVLERDAVMRTWYERIPVRSFDLSTVTDPQLRQALDRISDVTSYTLHAFDVGQEFGIPTVWLLAVNHSVQGPKSFSSSKAHPDVQIAILGALGELAGSIHYHESQYAKRRVDLLPMLDKPDLVREEFDHTLLAGLPEAFDRLSFLFERNISPRSLVDTIFSDLNEWRADIGVALQGLVGRVLQAGYDVIVVDQSPPEGMRHGICVAKVIIPGLLPFTIGHHLRRIWSAPRLRHTACECKVYPHPFP